jgi:hypothetical protein
MTPRAFVRLQQINGGQALIDIDDIVGVSQGGENVTLIDRRDGHVTLLIAGGPGKAIDAIRQAVAVADGTQRNSLSEYIVDGKD